MSAEQDNARIHRLTEVAYPQAVKHAADLIGELRAYTTPGRRGDTNRGAPGVTRTAPLSLGPVDDADDLYAALREHSAMIATELGTRPPRTIGREHHGEKGLPANTPPETAFTNARTLARYIEHQLPMIRDEDLITMIKLDLGERWERINPKYPPSARPEHVQARCVKCGCLTIDRHPPRSFGADENYTCSNCGRWHTEQEVITRRAARERELKSRPGRKKAS